MDNWTSTCKTMNLNRGLSPFTKTNSKCISNLNVKHKTIKFREDNFEEENIGENLDDFGYDAFIDKTPKTKPFKNSNW